MVLGFRVRVQDLSLGFRVYDLGLRGLAGLGFELRILGCLEGALGFANGVRPADFRI